MKNIMLFVLLLSFITITFGNGRVDVVGYTYYDWQWNGPPYTNLVCDTLHGIHVSWMTGGPSPSTDRNMGYNFYNFATGSWSWLAGTNVYTSRSGFGGMDVDLTTGKVILSTHQSMSGNLTPVLARDQAPGAGIFEYSVGPSGYQWLPIAITNNQAIHCALIDCVTTDSLYYTRVQPWNTWTPPINITRPIRPPSYPNHNINSSKQSNKLIVTWDAMHDYADCDSKYCRLSNDGGLTWQPPQLIIPPAFTPGSETLPTSWIGSVGFYDRNDDLHIVTQFHPVIQGAGYIMPSEIWHYCPTNSPPWSRVHRASSESIVGTTGYNATLACRPSIAQNPRTGALYVVWEQFDPLNYEPMTYCSRADIWVSRSFDNGKSWHDNQKITTPNTTSKRYPIVAGTVWNDTLLIRYIIDSIAGFELYSQGRATRNPVVVHWFPVPLTFGMEELSTLQALHLTFDAKPNPFSLQTAIRYAIPAKSNVSLEIFDVTGRLVRTLLSGTKSSGEYSLIWDGKDSQGARVKNGIYFCNLKVDNKTITRKIVMTN